MSAVLLPVQVYWHSLLSTGSCRARAGRTHIPVISKSLALGLTRRRDGVDIDMCELNIIPRTYGGIRERRYRNGFEVSMSNAGGEERMYTDLLYTSLRVIEIHQE